MMDVEYERQLFGFSRQEFIECLRSTVEDRIRATVGTARDQLKDALSDPEVTSKIDTKMDRLESFLIDNCEEPLKRLNARIEQCFRVPDGAVLPEDRRFSSEVSPAELEEARRRVTEARARALTAAADCVILRRELQRIHTGSFSKSVAAAKQVIRVTESAMELPSPFPPSFFTENAYLFQASLTPAAHARDSDASVNLTYAKI